MQIFNPPLKSDLQSTPADPSTTTSTTGVMMGLGGVTSIVPSSTGKIEIKISGDIDNTLTLNGSQVQIRYGTGIAPTNGAALTGTAAGGLVKYLNASDTGVLAVFVPGKGAFSLNAIISGLAIGTAYWIDISLGSITGGTSRVRDISISAIEL